MFEIVFDNVTILPANSCNRDIREMRANELVLQISEPKIEALVEEGYKVYDGLCLCNRDHPGADLGTGIYGTVWKRNTGVL